MNWKILFLLMLGSTILRAQEASTEKRIYQALPVNPHAPAIDGVLNDAIWHKALSGSDFTQTEPHDGKAPSQQTDFKIVYDAKNIYVAIRAHDTEVNKITEFVSRRDQGEESDRVAVLLDSYFDKRTAFEFGVNAAGVKIDGIWSDDGDNRDFSWDPIWDVATHIDDRGWTAEMRIPLSQIRFAKKDEHVWGLQVARYIYRENEWSMWQYFPQDAGGFVSRIGELHNIKGIETPRRIELLPYTISEGKIFPKEAGNPFATGRDGKINGGLDGKIGITSDLTLNFTVNPDFGQVEADPSEVNLSAFESFFAEKRPFFIAGRNIFSYGLSFGDGSNSTESLFYSRRLGRRPHHNPDLGDDEYADVPDNSSIISAAKITGKTRGGLSIGILDAVTARERAEIDLNGQRRFEVVEPAANYFVGRLQKDFDHGNTSVGGMFTAVNRDINEEHLNFINTAAYAGGIDVNHQWSDKSYWINFKTALSRIEGDRQAIYDAQTSSRRYFQRPDARHLTLDSTRTSLNGYAGAFGIGKTGGGHFRFMFGSTWRSPGFEINDLGFLRVSDRVLQFIWLSYREWQQKGWFRNFQININQWNGWNFSGEKIFVGGNINGGGRFKNNWRFWTGINREGREIDGSALRGGPALKFPGSWNQWWRISSDDTKPIRFGIGGSNNFNDDKISRRNNFFVDTFWRPAKAMSISIEPFYSFKKRNLQYVTTEDFAGEDRYLFARLNQKTLGIVFRANFSLTPTLSFQYYGQPFVSAGKYDAFKRITTPRADIYNDRFHVFSDDEISFVEDDEAFDIDENRDGTVDYSLEDPSFNFQEFRSNMVIRWEFRPGSTLFLVWSQQRSDSFSNGNFSFRRDFNSLFSINAENIFLAKFNYWFSL